MSKKLLEKQVFNVNIPWVKGDTITKWNEVCAWAVEQFGLPGDAFIAQANHDYMTFKFKNQQDAIYFSLRWE